MITKQVSKEMAEKEPYQLWNTFINILAVEGYEDLSDLQKMAQLVFFYESEVQNGGHMQFFENHGTDVARKTIEALKAMDASSQHKLLSKAYAIWCSTARSPIETTEQYCEQALNGEFDTFDKEFHSLSPCLNSYLERHFEENKAIYVSVV